MYTDAMKRAFRSLDNHCPKGFRVSIIDNEYFLTLLADEKTFVSLPDVDTKRQAVEYMFRVKKALEENGAIVLMTREGGKEL